MTNMNDEDQWDPLGCHRCGAPDDSWYLTYEVHERGTRTQMSGKQYLCSACALDAIRFLNETGP